MFSFIRELLGLGNKAMDKIFPDRAESRKAQAQINECEISGAPASSLRLWRSFLGWVLALCFVWEVAARPIIATYCPQARLPPSFVEETTTLLLGMLGLGF